MFEKVGEAGFSGFFIHRAYLVPDHVRDGGNSRVWYDDDAKAVLKREGFRMEDAGRSGRKGKKKKDKHTDKA